MTPNNGTTLGVKRPLPLADANIIYGDWQTPAITEQYAWDSARRRLPIQKCGYYFPFPWATLFDSVDFGGPRTDALLRTLDFLSWRLPVTEPRITVVQHIRLPEHANLVARAGITDVFWSHARIGMTNLPAPQQIRIHPFPLYPVQVPSPIETNPQERRKYLFSFVGAVGDSWYISDARKWIIRHLFQCHDAIVVGRSGWHFHAPVYESQVKGLGAGYHLIDTTAEAEFADSLLNSTFSLCPSGTGPNSLRLWESLAAGAIPVIISDGLKLPGDRSLWDRAAVFVPETESDVREIPQRLAREAADVHRLADRRAAMTLLLSLYGTSNFVHDIVTLVEDIGKTVDPPQSDQDEPGIGISPEAYARIVEEVADEDYEHINIEMGDVWIGGFPFDTLFFKAQLLPGAVGISLTSAEMRPLPYQWNDAAGVPIDTITAFFGEDGAITWSVEPSAAVRSVVLQLAQLAPDLIGLLDNESNGSACLDETDHALSTPGPNN